MLVVVAAVSTLEFAYTPPRSSYGTAILGSRPAGYWDLDELHGPQVHNAIGGKSAGRFRGPIGFGTSGATGLGQNTAVQLDGQGGSITLGTPVSSAEPISLAFWLRPDSGAVLGALNAAWQPPPESSTALWPWLVASQTTNAMTWTMTFEVPDRLSVDYETPSGTSALRTSARVEHGRFGFVVMTLGQEGPRLWVNGRPAAVRSRRIPRFPLARPSPLTFGGAPGIGLKSFGGTFDDIAAFPRKLSADEIRRLWRAGKSEAPE